MNIVFTDEMMSQISKRLGFCVTSCSEREGDIYLYGDCDRAEGSVKINFNSKSIIITVFYLNDWIESNPIEIMLNF